ncbi:FixH family protein [Plantactinospora sp. KLBMP9567]|uniref:copper resistance CopC/CopD family protein n=1 Tax=Plantactinospora sp. KLBMP9567 TaxID=3085900 RepID=UPI00298253A6|nr:FixH family protein [Plantactinospora sp. KLBMP9567]MDW5326002.1 FixH family protein [Plantactinospora sp. KLBMP9567]
MTRHPLRPPGAVTNAGWLLARLVATVLASLVGTVLVWLAAPTPAWAHADLIRSTPADGQVYRRSPERLQLQFTEPVTVAVAGFRLYDSGGELVPTGEPSHPSGDRTTVDVPLRGELPDGGYAVSWRVISADSHPVSGAYTFTVGSAGTGATGTGRPPGAGSSGSATGPVYGIVRWIAFLALALLIGAAFFVSHGWPVGAGRRAVRRLIWAGWAASLAGAVGAFLSYGPYLADLPLGRTFDPDLLASTLDTRLGAALLVRVGLLLLLAPALVLLLRRLAAAGDPADRRTGWLPPVAVLAAGAALAATWGVANHSAVGEFTALALASDVVHLVAMSVWLGGLAVLVGALLPSRDLAAMRSAVPVFSRTAMISVALLVATGLFQLWRQVRTVPALLETPYGRLLLAKLSVVLVLLALGYLARSWVHRQYAVGGSGRRPAGRRGHPGGPDPHQLYHFQRRVSMEAGLGLAVLGLTAALVATPPAKVVYEARQRGPAGLVDGRVGSGGDGRPALAQTDGTPAAPEMIPFDTGSGAAATGLLAIDVLPRRIGPATVHVSVLDATRRARAVAELRVSLRLPAKDLGPLTVPLTNAGPGHYLGTVTLPLPGRWEMGVTVRTSDVDQTTVRTELDVSA